MNKQADCWCVDLFLYSVYTIFRVRDYHTESLLSTHKNIVDSCSYPLLGPEYRTWRGIIASLTVGAIRAGQRASGNIKELSLLKPFLELVHLGWGRVGLLPLIVVLLLGAPLIQALLCPRAQSPVLYGGLKVVEQEQRLQGDNHVI